MSRALTIVGYASQESGRPETRAKYRVTANFSVDLRVVEL